MHACILRDQPPFTISSPCSPVSGWRTKIRESASCVMGNTEGKQQHLRSGKLVSSETHNKPTESLTSSYKMITNLEDNYGNFGLLSPQIL